MRQELHRRVDGSPPRRRPNIWVVPGLVAVVATSGWYVSRLASTEVQFTEQRSDQSLGGSIVPNEKATVRAPSGSELLSATAISVNEKPQSLLLVATSPGRTPKEGMAKIGVDRKAPQTYSAGAILLNGARLTEIHHRYVILERDGKRIRLTLNGKPVASELAQVGPVADETRPALATDRLSEVIRLSPVYENDLLIGMRVFPGTRSEILSQLGLQAGDIITAVNGAPLFEAGGMSDLFEPLLQGGQLPVTARRPEGDRYITLDGAVVTRILDSSVSAALPAGSPPSG